MPFLVRRAQGRSQKKDKILNTLKIKIWFSSMQHKIQIVKRCVTHLYFPPIQLHLSLHIYQNCLHLYHSPCLLSPSALMFSRRLRVGIWSVHCRSCPISFCLFLPSVLCFLFLSIYSAISYSDYYHDGHLVTTLTQTDVGKNCFPKITKRRLCELVKNCQKWNCVIWLIWHNQ